MRAYPRSARLAIAILYGRVRNARQDYEKTKKAYGVSSNIARDSNVTLIANENALTAVQTAAYSQIAGTFKQVPASLMIHAAKIRSSNNRL